MITKLTTSLLAITNALKVIAKDVLALCVPLSVILVLFDIFIGTSFGIIDKTALVIGLTKTNTILAAVIAYVVVTYSKK